MSTGDAENPFVDPSTDYGDSSGRSTSVGKSDTLFCARGVTLRLGTEGLVIVDEEYEEPSSRFCGLLPRKRIPSRSIPYFHILAAEAEGDPSPSLTIRYVRPTSSTVYRVATLVYPLEKPPSPSTTQDWVERLLARAYGKAKAQKRIKVLINPFGGKGGAHRQYAREIAPILVAAGCEVDVEATQYSGHAVELAEKLDVDRWDVVACCSGDGVPHEVFNGLGRRRDARVALRKLAVAQLPCGSGNAMSLNCNGTDSPSLAALCVVKGVRRSLDLTSVTQADRRTLSFLSQSVGIVAESDLGTENLRWMGNLRFTYGFLVRLFGRTVYPCDLALCVEVDGKDNIRAAYKRGVEHPVTPEDVAALRPESRGAAVSHNGEAGSDATDDQGEGLPPLRFGSMSDTLPAGWELKPQPTIGNFYSGNMAYMAPDTIFFPAALPADGCLDLVRIDGLVPRRAALRMLVAVGNNTLFNMAEVDCKKVRAYRIVPKERDEGYISIDGERIPFEPFQAEVHRGLGTTLVRGDSEANGGYQAPGPPPAVAA